MENLIDYFLDFIGKKKGTYLLKFRDGTKFFLRAGTTDRLIVNDLLFRDVYETRIILRDANVIVDVGAHIGVFSLLSSQRAKRIYALEPERENFQLLERNIRINKLEKKVTTLNVGLCKTNGPFFIYLQESSAEHSMMLPSHRKEKVSGISLKELLRKIPEKIDLMKIDCEGCEHIIFDGVKKEDLRKVEKIVMEVHRIEDKSEKVLLSKLKELGFKKIGVKKLGKVKIIFFENQMPTTSS